MARQNQKAALRLVEEASARKARERQGQQRSKSKMGQWIYILEEVWALHLVIAILIAGVGLFGLGSLDLVFSLLFADGAVLPLVRGIVWVTMLGAVIYVAKKLFIKEPMNVGNRIARTLTIIWTGFVLVVLWAFWAGIL